MRPASNSTFDYTEYVSNYYRYEFLQTMVVNTSHSSQLQDIAANLAKAITAYVCTLENHHQGLNNVNYGIHVFNTTYTKEIYVYLALLAAELILTLLFFTLGVAQSFTQDVTVWKSSPLVLLSHGWTNMISGNMIWMT